jgi:hypothetical protein
MVFLHSPSEGDRALLEPLIEQVLTWKMGLIAGSQSSI